MNKKNIALILSVVMTASVMLAGCGKMILGSDPLPILPFLPAQRGRLLPVNPLRPRHLPRPSPWITALV